MEKERSKDLIKIPRYPCVILLNTGEQMQYLMKHVTGDKYGPAYFPLGSQR